MNVNKFLKVSGKYKKCPNCGSSCKSTDLSVELEEDVIHISCICGFSKYVGEDNKEIQKVIN